MIKMNKIAGAGEHGPRLGSEKEGWIQQLPLLPDLPPSQNCSTITQLVPATLLTYLCWWSSASSAALVSLSVGYFVIKCSLPLEP